MWEAVKEEAIIGKMEVSSGTFCTTQKKKRGKREKGGVNVEYSAVMCSLQLMFATMIPQSSVHPFRNGCTLVVVKA